MPTPLPIVLRASPLPSDFRGTPQAFFDAMMARITLDTQEELALFRIGSVAPTSDVGPWLKDGTTWYVWNPTFGTYVPATIEFKAELNSKPWRGNSSGAQDIVFAGPASESVDLILSETFDPDGVFDSSVFTAPEDGYYHIDSKVGIAGTSGTPTGTTVIFYLKKNTFQMPQETVFLAVGDSLDGRTYSINTNLQLNAGDTIKGAVDISITGGSGTWTITENDTYLSGYKIRNLTF